MSETRINSAWMVVYACEPPREPAENLRALDVFDASDNLIEVLGRLADLAPAQAAYEAVLAKYPGNPSACARCAALFGSSA